MNKKCVVCDGDILPSSGWFVKGYRKGWVCSDECWDKYHQDERARDIHIALLPFHWAGLDEALSADS